MFYEILNNVRILSIVSGIFCQGILWWWSVSYHYQQFCTLSGQQFFFVSNTGSVGTWHNTTLITYMT